MRNFSEHLWNKTATLFETPVRPTHWWSNCPGCKYGRCWKEEKLCRHEVSWLHKQRLQSFWGWWRISKSNPLLLPRNCYPIDDIVELNSLFPSWCLALAVCHPSGEIKSTFPGKPRILWGLQWTQHRGKWGRGWKFSRRRLLRQQQRCELLSLFFCNLTYQCLQIYLNEMDADDIKCVPEKAVVSSVDK